jgi:iron-sulfur cluster repair protein YtfE (RIC family)
MEMHIYDLLRHEHARIARQLREITAPGASPATVAQRLDRLSRELYAHLNGEEQVLYPRLAREPLAREAVVESLEEHRLIRHQLDLLSQTPADDPAWPARARLLRTLVELHVDAEENVRFPQARKVVDDTEARDLAGAHARAEH